MKTINTKEYMMLEDYITGGVIPLHPTKKIAQKFATSIGWGHYHISKIERRFETVWIVAQYPIQNDSIGGMEFHTLRIPTGNYEYKNGTNQMIVLEVKKYLEKSA